MGASSSSEAAKSSPKSLEFEELPKLFWEIPMESSMDLMEQKVHELDARLKQKRSKLEKLKHMTKKKMRIRKVRPRVSNPKRN